VGQTSGTSAVGSASTLAETLLAAGKMAVAAMEAVDVQQLVQAVVSPAKVACSHCTTPTEEGSLARCGNGTHVFCSTCFTEVVRNAVRGPSAAVCIAAGGLVPCTWCRPHSAFDIKKFAALLGQECFTDWLDVMSGIKIAEEAAKWAEQLKKKDEEHFAALCNAGLVSNEEFVTRHYNLIAEKLICPACPRCGFMIADFDACCVLQCGRRDGMKWASGYGCGVYICAWCLEASDDEKFCTEHVKLCEFNPSRGAVFPPSNHPSDWRNVMNELARSRVKTYIKGSVQPGLQEQVYNKVCVENPEIGLGLQPWGTVVSDGWRPPTSARPPVQPGYEDKITRMLAMQVVNSRSQAEAFLAAARNDIDLAITFALASR
jgi:hypothetical protein